MLGDRFLASKLPVKKPEVETHSDCKADCGVHGRAQERIDPEVQVQEVRAVRPEHDEHAVRDIHDFRDAPNEVQTVRDDREDAAEEHAKGEVRGEDLQRGHAPVSP